MLTVRMGAPPADADADLLQKLTEALIDAQDRLFALRALTQVNIESLGQAEATTRMLSEAMVLTDSDVVVLVDDTTAVTAGSDDQAAAELIDLIRLERTIAKDPGPSPLLDGLAVAAPLTGTAQSIGFRRTSGTAYTTGDFKLIESVVSATDMMHTMTRLHLDGVRQATIEREHQLASSLAQAVLAAPLPAVPGVELFAQTTPARLAGGDFMTFSVVDGVLWFAVGDVAGKGLPAALVMTRTVSAARVSFLLHRASDVAGALRTVSTELYDYLDQVGLFVTALLGSYDPATGRMYLLNAGHSPVMFVHGDSVTLIPASTPPLGVVAEPCGSAQLVQMEHGDYLVVGSDGLAEQEDSTGAMVGYDALADVCRANGGRSAADLAEAMLAVVRTHADGVPASDDCTLAVLRAIEVR